MSAENRSAEGRSKTHVEISCYKDLPQTLQQLLRHYVETYVIPNHDYDFGNAFQKLTDHFKERGYEDHEIQTFIRVRITSLYEDGFEYRARAVARTPHTTDSISADRWYIRIPFLDNEYTKQRNYDGLILQQAVENFELQGRIKELEQEIKRLQEKENEREQEQYQEQEG